MNIHPCKYGKCCGHNVRCSNKNAVMMTGKTPSIGVCMMKCEFYNGVKRTSKLIRVTIEAWYNRSAGLGDTLYRLIHPIAKWVGLGNCGGCDGRRKVLNRRVPYIP